MGSVSSLNSLLSNLSAASNPSSVDLSSLLQAATGASSSGIDVTSAVSAAIYAAQAPERQWQAEQSTISSQITALTSVQTALSSLSNDLDDLNSITGSLAARSVSSSNSNEVSATASPGAAVGTHLVTVQNLAASASWYSPSMPSSTSALGTSTLAITNSGGTQSTFVTGSGVNSLTDLAGAINSSSVGVTASVVTDASGSRLALVSSTTGAAADFSVSYGSTGAIAWSSASVASASAPLSGGTSLVGDGISTATITVNAGDTLSNVANDINAQGMGLSASVVNDSSGAHLQVSAGGSGVVSVSADPTFSMTRASAAADAVLTVDGIPISSGTNTVSGAVSGLTLNLTGTVPSDNPVTLSVGADTATIGKALSTFVSDYNSALSLANAQFTYSTSSGSQGVLSGDSTLRALQGALLGIGGFSAGSSGPSSIQSLANLGITMNDDGSLALDTSTLNTAMADPSAVQSFFQGTTLNGFAQQFSDEISGFNNPANGSITNEISNLNQQYTALQSEVNDYESGYIASQRTVLTAMYSQAEIALQELPAQMQEIQNELGNNNSNG